MEPQIILWVLMVLALAAALVAGVFLTFSDFVMPSLFAAAPAAGTEAMQIINRKVYRSIFMVLLIGLIPVSAAIAIAAFLLDLRASQWLIAAGVLYFFGVFLASAVGNIPMNKRLEAMPQGGVEAQRYWPNYVTGWVRWNHVRWIAATGTAMCYLLAAIELAGAL